MHRAMHPWKTTSIPDLGKFLYRQVTRQSTINCSPFPLSRCTLCTTSPTTRQPSPGRTCTLSRRPSTTLLLSSLLPSASTLSVSSSVKFSVNLWTLAGARVGGDHRLCDGSLAWPWWIPVAWEWGLLPHASPQGGKIIIPVISSPFWLIYVIKPSCCIDMFTYLLTSKDQVIIMICPWNIITLLKCFVKALWLQLRRHACSPGLAFRHLCRMQRGGECHFLALSLSFV